MPSSHDADTDGSVHATAVALDGRAVLLIGPSGSGKSDLAVRLLDRDWRLIADDQTVCVPDGPDVMARCPSALAGKIEVRGVGIIELDGIKVARPAPIAGIVHLVTCSEDVERLPESATTTMAGRSFPSLRLAAFEGSAPMKLEIWVRSIGDVQNG